MHLTLGINPTEGFEASDGGAISTENLDHGTASLTMTADYLINAVVIYISRVYLHIAVGIAAKSKVGKSPD